MKAGWYPDPENPGHERQWDGAAWTQETRLAPPTAPVKPKKSRTFTKVLLGVVLGGLLLIGGCAAIIGIGLNSTEEDGITRSEFNSIQQGTTRSAIESKYGQPTDAQEFESVIEGLPASQSSCIYYPEKGKKVLEGATFQLCFDSNKLTSKNAYG